MRSFLYTMLLSMLPVVELRGGIPVGVAQGLDFHAAFIAAVIGTMLPVPFVILFMRRILRFLKRNVKGLRETLERFEERIQLKSDVVRKYQKFGLFLFVAIPLPGTGAWTGSLIASFLDIRLKDAILPIGLGVLTAGVIILTLTYGVTAIM